MSTHQHPDGLSIVTERAVIETFGATVASRIVDYPEHTRATLMGGRGAALSRLSCKCIGIHDAATIGKQVRKDFEDTMSEPTQTLAEYKTFLRGLLEAVRNGEDVDPREVAAAREAIELGKLRAEGEAERLAEAAALAEQQAREALCGPLNEQLEQSQARLQRKYTTALRAIEDLCESVDRHNRLVAENAGRAGQAVAVDRYTSHTTIGGTRHDFWTPQTWLLNMLHVVNKQWQLGRGTAYRVELPPAVQGGPRP